MKTMPKKKAKAAGEKKKAESGADVRGFISHTASDVIDEVEKASDVVMREIRDSFDFLSTKVTDTARYTAATTKAVRDRVTSKETVKQLHGLLDDLEEAGESLLKVIGSSFDTIKSTVVSGSVTEKKKKSVKKTSAKKATAKQTATNRKAPARKKAGAKKTTARRKAPARKKAAVKKGAVRKTAARKKAPARKKVARKKVARKKVARKAAG
jgi:hypothetical protein